MKLNFLPPKKLLALILEAFGHNDAPIIAAKISKNRQKVSQILEEIDLLRVKNDIDEDVYYHLKLLEAVGKRYIHKNDVSQHLCPQFVMTRRN